MLKEMGNERGNRGQRIEQERSRLGALFSDVDMYSAHLVSRKSHSDYSHIKYIRTCSLDEFFMSQRSAFGFKFDFEITKEI